MTWKVEVSTDPLHVYPSRESKGLIGMYIPMWAFGLFGWRLKNWAWGNLEYPKNERNFKKAINAAQYVCDKKNAKLKREQDLVDRLGL